MSVRIVLAGTANQGQSGIGTCPALERAFSDLGFEIGNLEDSQVLVALNHNDRALKRFDEIKTPGKLRFLIALEPKSVFPIQYTRKILNVYNYCFYPGNVQRQNFSSEILGWPYKFNENPAAPKPNEVSLSDHLEELFSDQIFDFAPWSQRRINLSMIAANKVSPTNENLYGLRRKIVGDFNPEFLKLYGPLWTDPLKVQFIHRVQVLAFSLKSHYMPNLKSVHGDFGRRYQCALGPIKNKHAILRGSKFSLVIENSSENITEKLFDSLINGSIPIYIGPDLQTAGIPEDVAIQGLRDAESISKYIKQISRVEIVNRLVAISEFLQSQTFLNTWGHDAVFKRIAKEISMKVLTKV